MIFFVGREAGVAALNSKTGVHKGGGVREGWRVVGSQGMSGWEGEAVGRGGRALLGAGGVTSRNGRARGGAAGARVLLRQTRVRLRQLVLLFSCTRQYSRMCTCYLLS